MGKIIKNQAVNFLAFWLIFLLVFFWIFSGWPQIFNFPPKIQQAEAIQTGTPDGDISAGSWTDEGTSFDDGSLYTSIREASADNDTSYIVDVGANTTCEVSLTDMEDPGVDTGHEIHVWMKGIGTAGPERLTVGLYQGETEIETSGNLVSPDAYTEQTFALDALTVANIDDYTALQIRMTAANLGSGEEMRVTKVELQIPDVAAEASITITSNGVVLYGTIALGGTQNTVTIENTQTAKNNGTVAEDFKIKTTVANGTTTDWTLQDSGDVGVNIFNHFASIDGANFTIAMNVVDTYVTLKNGVANEGSVSFDLQIGMPTETDDYQLHNITITVMAEIP